MRWALIGMTVVVGFVLPVNGSALVLAPPGHAGTNQYVEVIPTSGGDAAPPGTVRGSGNSNASGSALAPFGRGAKGDARLAKLGKDGQAAAALAASTAPTPAPGKERELGAAAAASAGGGSVASGLSHALGSSDTGGLGLLLPLLLATAFLVALGIVLAGFRSGRRPAGG
jgi:hypothetical protein